MKRSPAEFVDELPVGAGFEENFDGIVSAEEGSFVQWRVACEGEAN